ncbi:MAG TPA: DUF998 domain-containing protein [Nocardioidaceae bacterium]|nr:DUF998 domain-containing protein [Nocardioidaceae bacterium]
METAAAATFAAPSIDVIESLLDVTYTWGYQESRQKLRDLYVIAAGARYPGYSAISDTIGGLGAKDAPHPDLIGAGFLALSAATVAAGIALFRLLPGRSGRAASIVVILAGASVSSLAFVQQDCTLAKAKCVNAGLSGDLSTAHTLHRLVAVLAIAALVGALVMMTVSLRGSSDFESWAEATTWVTLAAGTLFVWFGSELYGDLGGFVERLVMVFAFGWPVVLSVGLTRRHYQLLG